MQESGRQLFLYENLVLCDKNEKVKKINVDYGENYLVLLTTSLKLYLYYLKTLDRLTSIDLKNLAVSISDDVEFSFGKLNKLIYVWNEKGIIVIKIVESEKSQELQLLHVYKLLGITNLTADPFRKNWVFMVNQNNLQYVRLKKGALKILQISMDTQEQNHMEIEQIPQIKIPSPPSTIIPSTISPSTLMPLSITLFQSINPSSSITNKIPLDLLQYSDEENSQPFQQLENGQNKIHDIYLIKYLAKKDSKIIIVFRGDTILILKISENKATVISKYEGLEDEGKFQGMQYSESTRMIAIYEFNQVSLFHLSAEYGITCVNYKAPQLVEKIIKGVFFDIPYHKSHECVDPYLFVFSFYDGYVRCSMCWKIRYDHGSIYGCRWDNSMIIVYDNGTLNILKMHKQSQWENLDFRFKYTADNSNYIEQEDEFDAKQVNFQKDLDPNIFMTKLYHPYQLELQVKL